MAEIEDLILIRDWQINEINNTTITNSELNRPCFAWHPYGKSGLFKTELVINTINKGIGSYAN